MADDDALIAKAAEALLRERRRRWGSVHQGDCITDARAVLAAVRDQIAAEALREAADEIHREARWQTEQQMRNAGRSSASEHYYAAERLTVVESVLRDRADRLEPEATP